MATRALLVMVALLAFPSLSGANEVTCPPTYSKTLVPASSIIGPIKEGASLDAVQVIAGQPGDEAKNAPATLAPDDEVQQGKDIIQTWPLLREDIKEGLILICRYKGEAGYLRYPLVGVTECTARLKGINKGFETASMICR